MTHIFPDSVHFEVYIGNWVDLTPDVIGQQTATWGITGNSQIDRVASSGQMEFTLRNDEGCLGGIAGYYSPYVSGSMAGWRTGLPCRLRFVLSETEFIRFFGRISGIQPTSGSNGPRQVSVTVADWMELAATNPIISPELAYDQRIDQIVPLIVAGMPIQPQRTIYHPGQDTFPTAFDTVRSNTRVLSEFNKVALSELGYIYLRHDQPYGETLVVEGRHTRSANDSLLMTPLLSFESDRLLMEDGDHLLQETGDLIVIEALKQMEFNNNMTSLDVSYGTNVVNLIQAKVYPRRIDSAATSVLFSLSTPIALAAGETKANIRALYRDPTAQASKVNGKDMVNPVATTDYLMYANSDGTGSNLTANLAVTAVYGSEGVYYTLVNTGGTAGYVTKLQARGRGIYTYDALEYVTEDATSRDQNGYLPLVLDMKYQNDPTNAVSISTVLMNQDKDARQIVNGLTACGNYDSDLMRAFLYGDVGDLIHLTESQTGADGYYYIQQVSFILKPVGVIHFSWLLKEALNLEEVYWELEVAGKSELGTTTFLGY
jgi:hypothetical protein